MLTHDEMVGLQAERHQLIDARSFHSKEEYVIHLMHAAAYTRAGRIAEGKTVLDIGCNTGYGSEILSRTARSVVGVDVSAEAVRKAQQDYGDTGIDFQLTDGKRLPFPDGVFEMVVSCQVVEHVVNYDVYFGEIKRILSPTGIAVFTTPNAKMRLDPGMKPWNEFHVREFEHAALKTLMDQHFARSDIEGLFAEDELYSIEKGRVTRARNAARQASGVEARSLRSIAKRVVPAIVWDRMRAAFHAGGSAPGKMDDSFLDRHDASEFFYRSEDLDAALDFMAICLVDSGVPHTLDENGKS